MALNFNQIISNIQQGQNSNSSNNIAVPDNWVNYQNKINKKESQIKQNETSENITNKQTAYDYKNAVDFGNQEMSLQQPYIDINNKLTEDYLTSLNAIYERYNPDKVKPLQADERLANIQALSVALGDLARALGKSAGNNNGLGMVTVDNDNKFSNMLNKAWTTRDKRREAEAEEGLRQLNQMVNKLKERYSTNKENQKIFKQAYDKGYERYLRDNNTTTTINQSNKEINKSTEEANTTYVDPNGKKYKDNQERLNMARERLRIAQQRFQHDQSNWDKENTFINPYYRRFDWSSDNGKALHDSPAITFSDNEIRKYYSALQKYNVFEKYIPTIKVDQYGNERRYFTPAKNLNKMKEDIHKLFAESYGNINAYYDIDKALNSVNFKTDIGV